MVKQQLGKKTLANRITSRFFKLRNAVVTLMALAMMNLMSLSASATTTPAPTAPTVGTQAGDDMWEAIVNFIATWIPRLGGAIVVIGLIMFGLGWQRDDADGKTRGIQVAIGGAIVFAVGFMTETFMG